MASPDVVVIEDELNLEDLMKQKELLQARLGAFLSDSEGEVDHQAKVATPPATKLPVAESKAAGRGDRARNGDKVSGTMNKNDVVLLLDDSSGEHVAKRGPAKSAAPTTVVQSVSGVKRDEGRNIRGSAGTRSPVDRAGRGDRLAADDQDRNRVIRQGGRTRSPSPSLGDRSRDRGRLDRGGVVSPRRGTGPAGPGLDNRRQMDNNRNRNDPQDNNNRNRREDLRREIDRDRDRNNRDRERERERMRRHEGQQERGREFDRRDRRGRNSPEPPMRRGGDDRNRPPFGGGGGRDEMNRDRDRRGGDVGNYRNNRGGVGDRRDRDEDRHRPGGDRRREGNNGDGNGNRRDGGNAGGRKRKESSSGSDLGDIDIKDDDDEEDEEKIIEQRRRQREELLKVRKKQFYLNGPLRLNMNIYRNSESRRRSPVMRRVAYDPHRN